MAFRPPHTHVVQQSPRGQFVCEGVAGSADSPTHRGALTKPDETRASVERDANNNIPATETAYGH